MAKKVTDTATATAPASRTISAQAAADPPVDDGNLVEEPGGATPDPAPAETGDRASDCADRLLKIFARYSKLYIDRHGSIYTEDTPASLRADAALYDNPYHKA